MDLRFIYETAANAGDASTQLSPQDDLLIAVALCRYSFQFEDAEPLNSARAWELAVRICAQHGLDPTEAALQLQTGRAPLS